MPHGISIDPQGNIWLTDVALHQVFRFKRDQLNEPDLVLGERFVPGDDSKHFCKPTVRI
jgi:peptidylamidoglycolate lyase